MHFLNGSTHILNSKLIEFPGENCKLWSKLNLFTDHGYLKYRLKEEKDIELKPIPFYCVIYIRNNITNISRNHFQSRNKLKSIIKKIYNYRIITDDLRQEYNLDYKKKEILRLSSFGGITNHPSF